MIVLWPFRFRMLGLSRAYKIDRSGGVHVPRRLKSDPEAMIGNIDIAREMVFPSQTVFSAVNAEARCYLPAAST